VKILNLYAGIGGNRKLWGDEHQITAVEYMPDVAAVYAHMFPTDTVVIADAHQYLLEHYSEFDFIWSSPPCPSHSRARQGLGVSRGQVKPIYADMRLYEEIIFLQYNFRGLYAVENVQPYYEPLIKPTAIVQRHPFWANYDLRDIGGEPDNISSTTNAKRQHKLGIDLANYKLADRTKALRNCMDPLLGKYVLDMATLSVEVIHTTYPQADLHLTIDFE